MGKASGKVTRHRSRAASTPAAHVTRASLHAAAAPDPIDPALIHPDAPTMGMVEPLPAPDPVITAEPPRSGDIAPLPADAGVDATRAHIAETRAEMSETLDAIKEQLSPHHIAEEAKESLMDAANEKIAEIEAAVKPMVRSAKAKIYSAIDTTREALEEPGEAARKTATAVAAGAKKRPALAAVIVGALVLLIVRNRRAQARERIADLRD